MKILIQDGDGVRALEEGYASEEELQTFLREHPDLMPLDEIELGAPSLLCIGWEVGLASGAEDILYIDENGLLTVIETKLRKNPESRRAVVGQILEYAAQMATWSSADVERQAEKFFASSEGPEGYRGCTLAEALQKFLESTQSLPEFSYDHFLEQVKTNIDRGHFRLIIAIDEPPEPLLKTVEFINRFSERFEIFLVQLKRFRDLARKQNIFVPALFGRVPTTTTTSRGQKWDEARFEEHLKANNDNDTVNYVLKIYKRFSEETDVPLWGSGITYGSFSLVVLGNEGRVNLATVTSRGDLYVNFGWLESKVAEKVVRSLSDGLNKIEGVSLPRGFSSKYPAMPKSVLRDPRRLAKVMDSICTAANKMRAT